MAVPDDARAEGPRDLLSDVQEGKPDAIGALLQRERPFLLRMVALRLDRRLSARVGISDVVQNIEMEVARRLPAHLAEPRMPFHLWLRWIAREQILAMHRHHLGAEKRAVPCELPPLAAESASGLIDVALGTLQSPSEAAGEAERAETLRLALERLPEEDREIILWRHFEQLSNAEVAALLDIQAPAASKRYVRALERLRALLGTLDETAD